MKKIKVFDVVELKNKDKATILKSNTNTYMAEVVGENGETKEITTIDESNIERIIYRNSRRNDGWKKED